MLVIVDYFTKWTESYAIPNQANGLVERFNKTLASLLTCYVQQDQGSSFTESTAGISVKRTRVHRLVSFLVDARKGSEATY